MSAFVTIVLHKRVKLDLHVSRMISQMWLYDRISQNGYTFADSTLDCDFCNAPCAEWLDTDSSLFVCTKCVKIMLLSKPKDGYMFGFIAEKEPNIET